MLDSLVSTEGRVYITTGILSILVFVVAVGFAIVLTPVELTASTLISLTVGFLGYMGVYFASLYAVRFVESED